MQNWPYEYIPPVEDDGDEEQEEFLDEESGPQLPDLRSLSLEQKVAQVLSPFFSTHRLFREEQPVGLERFVKRYGIGCIHVGHGNLKKTQTWVRRFQDLALEATGIPVLIAADAEQGIPHAFRCGNELPWQMALGSIESPDAARRTGYCLGKEARAMGIDVVFGPCVDVNTNPLNKAIATRAFGSDPELVAALSVAYVQGLQDAGVAATLKHFPGHGATIEDSHLFLPEDASPLEDYDSIHLPPFQACIDAGAMAVMTGHIYAKALDAAHITTVSHHIMTERLRHEMGFEGVLFTDSLNMSAINQGQSKRRAALDAFLAGCDILLHPAQADRIESFWRYFLDAVERGQITEEGLDQAVLRVLQMKQKLLPHQQKMPSPKQAETLHQDPEHLATIESIALRSITRVSPQPYKALEAEGISLVVAVDSTRKKDIPTTIQAHCSLQAPNSQHFLLTEETPLLDVARLHHELSDDDRPIVLAVFSPMLWGKGRSLLAEPLRHRIFRLFQGLEVHTSVVFGSPYILHEVPGTHQLCAYGPSQPSQKAVVEVLFGDLEPNTQLPLPWPGIEVVLDEEESQHAA